MLNDSLPYHGNFTVTKGNVTLPYTAKEYCRVQVKVRDDVGSYGTVIFNVNGVAALIRTFMKIQTYAFYDNIYLRPGDVLSRNDSDSSISVTASVFYSK